MPGKFLLSALLVLLTALTTVPIDAEAATVVVHGKKNRHKTVVTLPARHKTIHYRGADYYYVRGTYYRKRPSGYIVIAPPVGLIIATLPTGYTTVHIDSSIYFHYQGVYYQPVPSGYIVVADPHPVPSVTVQPKATIGTRIIVNVDKLNVRSGPGKNYRVIRVLGSGNQLKVLEVGENWYYVELSDKKAGWVMIRHTAVAVSPAQG